MFAELWYNSFYERPAITFEVTQTSASSETRRPVRDSGRVFIKVRMSRSPHIRESKTVLDSEFHAVDSGFQVLDSNLCQRNLDSGFLGQKVPRLACKQTLFCFSFRSFFSKTSASSRSSRGLENERGVRERKTNLFSSFPTPTPLRWWSINLPRFIFYHARSTNFEEKIEVLWTGFSRIPLRRAI